MERKKNETRSFAVFMFLRTLLVATKNQCQRPSSHADLTSLFTPSLCVRRVFVSLFTIRPSLHTLHRHHVCPLRIGSSLRCCLQGMPLLYHRRYFFLLFTLYSLHTIFSTRSSRRTSTLPQRTHLCPSLTYLLAAPATPQLLLRIKADVKDAMRSKDKERLAVVKVLVLGLFFAIPTPDRIGQASSSRSNYSPPVYPLT